MKLDLGWRKAAALFMVLVFMASLIPVVHAEDDREEHEDERHEKERYEKHAEREDESGHDKEEFSDWDFRRDFEDDDDLVPEATPDVVVVYNSSENATVADSHAVDSTDPELSVVDDLLAEVGEFANDSNSSATMLEGAGNASVNVSVPAAPDFNISGFDLPDDVLSGENTSVDADRDGIPDYRDSDPARNTDRDHDGIDDSVDTRDDRPFLVKLLAWLGFIH